MLMEKAIPLVAFIGTALVAFVYVDARSPSTLSQLLRPPEDQGRLGRSLDDQSRHEKRQEEPLGYFVQCRPIRLWQEEPGRVSVFTFLDPYWQYSYRHAIMLSSLKDRLRRSGFENIWFYVVMAAPDLPVDEMENELEIMAWRQIAMADSYGLLTSVKDILKNVADNEEYGTSFIQDNSELRIWETFNAARNQVVVVDRCGKLAYQIIVPWSILYFPYVKAAILSTYKDEPCGPCNIKATDGQENSPTSHSSDTSTKYSDPRKLDDSINQDDSSTASGKIETITRTADNDSDDTPISTLSVPLNSEDLMDPKSIPTNLMESMTMNSNFPQSYTTIDQTANPLIMNENDVEEQNNFTMFNHEESTDTIEMLELGTLEESTQTVIPYLNLVTENPEGFEHHTLLDQPDHGVEASKLEDVGIRNENGKDEQEIVSENGHAYSVGDADNKDGEKSGVDESNSRIVAALPLRIIMRAPHVHKNGEKLKRHEYLVLKTGNPDYHGHLEAEEDVIPDSQENYRGSVRKSDANSNGEGSLKHYSDQKLGDYIYSKDESPGLYGEIIDYWENYEDVFDRNETMTSNADYNVGEMDLSDDDFRNDNVSIQLTNLTKVMENDRMDSQVPVSTLKDMSQVEGNNFIQLIDVANMSTRRDEEAKNRSIAHYAKLLPWIYYVLNK